MFQFSEFPLQKFLETVYVGRLCYSANSLLKELNGIEFVQPSTQLPHDPRAFSSAVCEDARLDLGQE